MQIILKNDTGTYKMCINLERDNHFKYYIIEQQYKKYCFTIHTNTTGTCIYM